MTAMEQPGERFDRDRAVTRVLDNISDLTDVRHVSEPVQREGEKRTRRHVHTLPSLLEALKAAVSPGADMTQLMGARSFESRPAARLDPIQVLRRIDTQARECAARFGIQRSSLAGFLSALRGAAPSLNDGDLRWLDTRASKWRKDAREATGEDPAPIQMNRPCPDCHAKNSITLRCDPDMSCVATCSKCQKMWPPDLIELMVRQMDWNENYETMTEER